jgi:membrane protease subunit HflK
MMRRLKDRVGGGRGGQGPGRGFGASGFAFMGAIAFLTWLGSGIYVVRENERAVVTRFGAFARESGPGLHVHLPFPLEAREMVNVSGQQEIKIDADETNPNGGWMLTKDEALILVDFNIVYQVSDAQAFVFNVQDPKGVTRAVGESAMREIVAQTVLDGITTTERAAVEIKTKELMQQILTNYKSGVSILRVQLNKVAPPNTDVQDAFAEVDQARQDAVSKTNEAARYRNEIVPQARGEAAKKVAEAEAYSDRIVREARGEAERFNLVYEQYRRNPRVTRERLYLETMERVYGGADKIIVDGRTGVQPYLPLEQLRRPSQPQQAQAPAVVQPQAEQPGGR